MGFALALGGHILSADRIGSLGAIIDPWVPRKGNQVPEDLIGFDSDVLVSAILGGVMVSYLEEFPDLGAVDANEVQSKIADAALRGAAKGAGGLVQVLEASGLRLQEVAKALRG